MKRAFFICVGIISVLALSTGMFEAMVGSLEKKVVPIRLTDQQTESIRNAEGRETKIKLTKDQMIFVIENLPIANVEIKEVMLTDKYIRENNFVHFSIGPAIISVDPVPVPLPIPEAK